MAIQTVRQILSREFILTSLAQFVFTFVFFILIPTLPIYLSRSGSTEAEIGVLIGIFFFSSLLLRPFVGKALLKIDEKKFMTAGALLFTLTSPAYLLAPPFWPLLFVRFFQGIGFAFFHTASFTLIANITPQDHRGQSLGYFYLAMNISGALAPPVGMFIINQFSFTSLFLVCSGLSLCSLLITHQLKKRQVHSLEASSLEGGFLLSRKALPPSVIGFFALFIWGALAAFFPLYAMNHGVANPGLFFATMAVMLILGRSLGGKLLDLYSREIVILPCLTTYIISMILLAFSETLPMFILVAVIWGIGHAFLVPSLVVYTLDRMGSSPGPAMGMFTAFADLGISLGPVLMGIVVHSTSYPIMFFCLALTGAINLIYFYFFVRKRG
jgi:predicted MFS family arabinose efflux permease